ncbi:MAG: DUF1648 domain-containing protein [Oscillospiraceae bacterium]
MKRILVLSWILTVLMLIVGAAFFPWLPDEIAIQWNNGAVSNTAGRWIVFALPALTAAIIGLHILQTGKTESERKFQRWFLMVPILLFSVQAVVISNAMGYIDLSSADFWLAQTIALLLVGGLLLLFGNALPKLAKSYYCGVKAPGLINNDLWTKTQRFAAKLWCAAGHTHHALVLYPLERDFRRCGRNCDFGILAARILHAKGCTPKSANRKQEETPWTQQ